MEIHYRQSFGHAKGNVQMKRKTPPTKTYKTPAKKPRLVRQNAQAAITTLGHEIGYFDAAIAADASTTPVIVDLNAMAAGDTNITRDGNKIGMIALGLRIAYNIEAVTQNVRARFVVVLDKQPNGAAPTWLGVYDTATIESQRVVGSLSRYDILMDKVVTVNSTTTSATALQKGFFKKYCKMPNIISSFVSAAAGPPFTNSLSLMYISDVVAGVTDMDVSGTTRLYFNR